jgi:hypothetical protein
VDARQVSDKIFDEHAYVCPDCYQLEGSGDLSSLDYWYGDDAETKVQELYANVEATLSAKPEVRTANGSIWTHAHGPLRITLGWGREEHACATNYTVTYTHDGVDTVREVRADDAAGAIYEAFLPELIGDTFTVTCHELQTVGDLGGECDCETDNFRSDRCAMCGQYMQGATMHAATIWEVTGDE